MCVWYSNFRQIQEFHGVSEGARFRGFRDNYFVSKYWNLQFLFAFECRIRGCTFRIAPPSESYMCTFSRTDLFFERWANVNIPLELHCNSAHHYTPFHMSQTKTWKILYWIFFFRAVSEAIWRLIFILSVTLSYFLSPERIWIYHWNRIAILHITIPHFVGIRRKLKILFEILWIRVHWQGETMLTVVTGGLTPAHRYHYTDDYR